MSNGGRITINLAGGGDERIKPSSLLYVRRPTYDETRGEPEVESVVVIGGVRFSVVSSSVEVADRFAAAVKVVTLTAPDSTLLFVNAEAVVDVDRPATRQGKSVLVFGIGPRAPRLGVGQTREELADIWKDVGLDPDNHGI
ncbi:MAG: hypothetical protein AAFW66_08355 [Pseudomonadota bacterium]